MEKKWLFIVGVVIITLITAIALLGITATTGSAIYGKCWNLQEHLSADSELSLKMQGCIPDSDNLKVCCPFDSCPEAKEVKCGP